MRFTSGIICGSGSFAVQFGDHFRSGDHLRSGIICGAVHLYLSSSSSQNITANQITSQKSSSSIDSRHFNFHFVGKKFLLPVFFTVLSETNDLMETKESQESLQSRLSFFHLGRLFSSDRDDSSDSDDYLETGL